MYRAFRLCIEKNDIDKGIINNCSVKKNNLQSINKLKLLVKQNRSVGIFLIGVDCRKMLVNDWSMENNNIINYLVETIINCYLIEGISSKADTQELGCSIGVSEVGSKVSESQIKYCESED